MLVGGDLGLPYFLLVVVVVVVPAIGFVVRRKWRHAALRREEIRRLLVLASEEAARAEVEASEGYYYTTDTVPAPVSVPVPVPSVSSFKPQHQCEVCFSPTNTRCAKCKAVRYCSSRCQIIHWRQGHKDECRPYVASKSDDAQGDREHYSDSFSSDGLQTARPSERSPEGLQHKDDVGIESVDGRRQVKSNFKLASESSCEEYSAFSTPSNSSVESSSSSSSDTDRVDACRFVNTASENIDRTESEHLISLARNSTSSRQIHQNQSNHSDEDTHSGSSSSSSPTDDGTNESSFSEPATPSSGFWHGTVLSKKSNNDELEDGDINDSRSPLKFSFDTTEIGTASNVEEGFTGKPIMSNENGAAALRSRKSNVETTLSKEMEGDGLKSRRPPTLTSGMSKHGNAIASNDFPESMCRKSTSSVSGTSFYRATAGEGQHALKDARTPGGLQFSTPETLTHVLNDKSVSSHASKPTEIGSSLTKNPDIHLTSSTSRHVSQSTKSTKVSYDNHKVIGRSSQSAENSQSATNGLKTSVLKVVDQLKPSKLSRHCSFGGGGETAHRYNCKGLFSYELFVKLYNWKKVELQPCGLINCGNSCYANVVLQCLAFTPPLTAYLLEGYHSKACDKREWCFTCEFESLVLKAKDGNSPLSPIRILSHIENIGSNLGHGREEDAHEFLRYVIDALQSVYLKEAKTKACGSSEEETTLVGLTFGGYLRSKIKCMKCGGKSERQERMMDLTVEIEGDIGTLEEALNKFTCTEILDGENKYKCNRCKSYERAKKKLTVLEAPNVLTIALKRFQSGKFGKLNKSIHFPEILDMAPYVSGTSDKSPIYRLYGVVVHVDIMNAAFSGHYVCYVKNVQNRWFKIDDSMVKEVDLHSVLTKGAYMLFYARCSPRAPRSIRGSLIHHHDPRKQKSSTSFKSRSHTTEPWDVCGDHLTSGPPVRHRSLEEESSSSDNSSGFFSESCSCSTESSHRDSSSNEDHIFGDWERDYWNNSSPSWMNRNSSDSDASSSSSFPSPMYASRMSGETYEQESWLRERSRSCKAGVLYGDDDHMTCRELGCSSRCRETNLDRLGGRGANLLEISKPGVTFRKSTSRGRSD